MESSHAQTPRLRIPLAAPGERDHVQDQKKGEAVWELSCNEQSEISLSRPGSENSFKDPIDNWHFSITNDRVVEKRVGRTHSEEIATIYDLDPQIELDDDPFGKKQVFLAVNYPDRPRAQNFSPITGAKLFENYVENCDLAKTLDKIAEEEAKNEDFRRKAEDNIQKFRKEAEGSGQTRTSTAANDNWDDIFQDSDTSSLGVSSTEPNSPSSRQERQSSPKEHSPHGSPDPRVTNAKRQRSGQTSGNESDHNDTQSFHSDDHQNKRPRASGRG